VDQFSGSGQEANRATHVELTDAIGILTGRFAPTIRKPVATLREWEDYYNYHRPHGGLDGQTPYERLLQKTAQPVTDQRQQHSEPVGVAAAPASRSRAIACSASWPIRATS
jgi:hypothetical protein